MKNLQTQTKNLKPGAFASVEEAKRANLNAGEFYFSPSTVSFFKARTAQTLNAGRVLVESVARFDGVRLYGIFIFLDDGTIQRLRDEDGELFSTESASQARRVAQEIAASIYTNN